MTAQEIIMKVLEYFWEIFKFWKLLPEDVAADIEAKFENA